MPTLTEQPIDFATLVPATQEPAYKDKLDQAQRQEYMSQKARWREARHLYITKPQEAYAICAGCMRRLDFTAGVAVHQNVVTLQAELKCPTCYEKSPRASLFTLVKEI